MVESLASGKYTPIGVFEYARNFKKKDIGDHIDFLTFVAGSFTGGGIVKLNGA